MKPYSKYKASGVKWIGDIPENWKISKIKYTTYVKGRIGWQGLRSDEFKEISDSYLITGTDFKDGKIDLKNCYQIEKERYDEDTKIQLKENDLLITKDGTIGKIALVKNLDKIATLNSGIFLTRPKTKLYTNDYLYWILTSNIFKQFIDYHKTGSTILHLYQNVFVEFKYPCPSINTQTLIANFLDRKTTELDTLIANKQRLIELLKEERTAIINHAITKGINPNVKFKDSGIEWIGEIPEHWEVKRLKSVSESVKTGSTPPTEEESYFNPEEIDWFGPADFGEFILKDAKRKISKLAIVENKCRLFPKNTILLIGIGATVGKVGITLKECASNQQINAIILKNEVSPFYCLYYLSLIRDIINMEASSSTLPIFNQTQTKNIIIPIPPISEQLEIANYIETKTTEIDTIISQTEKEIDLLKEYKTALISEVVLGKVDVREEILSE